jgi:hypothetical protein
MDKTDIITMNQLAVISMIPLEHATVSDVMFASALSSQVLQPESVISLIPRLYSRPFPYHLLMRNKAA